MSSFSSIKKLAEKTGDSNGMAPKSSFKGVFTRSGESRQLESELKPETIANIKNSIPDFEKNYFPI